MTYVCVADGGDGDAEADLLTFSSSAMIAPAATDLHAWTLDGEEE